jgi:hypothetical protein
MRQFRRSDGLIVVAGCAGAGGRRDRVSRSQVPTPAPAAANAIASEIATVAELNDGNSVVITRVPDSTSSTEMISPASMFSQRRFVHGPSTSRSLHSSSKNTLALGSSTPASACTAVVSRPSGVPGMSTIPAATKIIAA